MKLVSLINLNLWGLSLGHVSSRLRIPLDHRLANLGIVNLFVRSLGPI